MENNQLEFKKEFDKLLEKAEENSKQIEIDYPEYPDAHLRGLDGGNHVLRKKQMENSRWVMSEIKKLKEKYEIE